MVERDSLKFSTLFTLQRGRGGRDKGWNDGVKTHMVGKCPPKLNYLNNQFSGGLFKG